MHDIASYLAERRLAELRDIDFFLSQIAKSVVVRVR